MNDNKRSCAAVLALTFVLGAFVSMFAVSVDVNAAPVIEDYGNSGRWSDSFEDATGIASQNNITVANDEVQLKGESQWDYEWLANTDPDAAGWTLTENAGILPLLLVGH